MTPSEVQRIELALRGLTAEMQALCDRFDKSEEKADDVREDVDELKSWRSKAQGAAWAVGILWTVAMFAFGAAIALIGGGH